MASPPPVASRPTTRPSPAGGGAGWSPARTSDGRRSCTAAGARAIAGAAQRLLDDPADGSVTATSSGVSNSIRLSVTRAPEPVVPDWVLDGDDATEPGVEVHVNNDGCVSSPESARTYLTTASWGTIPVGGSLELFAFRARPGVPGQDVRDRVAVRRRLELLRPADQCRGAAGSFCRLTGFTSRTSPTRGLACASAHSRETPHAPPRQQSRKRTHLDR